MLITAHTGCDQTPDNSLQYLDYVLTTGADGLEVDIRKDPSGLLYLGHDRTDEERVSLDEVFKRLRHSGMFCNCDLKESGTALSVLHLAEQYRVEDQICFTGTVEYSLIRESSSVRKRTLINLQPILPGIGAKMDCGYLPGESDFQAVMRVIRETGGWAINVPFRFCTEEMLSFFKRHQVAVSAWTVDEEEPAKKLAEADIYNITTRKPKMLLRIRESLRKEEPAS